MDLMDKLSILSDAAKYDVACTSSGSDRAGNGGLGTAVSGGICHTWTPDGRCVSLLKVLMDNRCKYDCAYCLNRCSAQVRRTFFTPDELCELTLGFYRRNYIEGLFLSSAVCVSADATMERMVEALRLIRHRERFNGYIHIKVIPGADPALINAAGMLADRMSVNIEMPSQDSLALYAPDKSKTDIITPMRQIRDGVARYKEEAIALRRPPRFSPAGQATQMVIGASPDDDRKILLLSEGLYDKYRMRRVFYSAYVPVGNHLMLPDTPPPLLREHRLYQADWLMRFYGFDADEILTEERPYLDPVLDPKAAWAVNHLELFPLEVNKAPREMLLRVPGLGLTSIERILKARALGPLNFDDLKRIGVVLKRARYFLTAGGRMMPGVNESLLVNTNGFLHPLRDTGYAKLGVQQLSFIEQVPSEGWGKQPITALRPLEPVRLLDEGKRNAGGAAPGSLLGPLAPDPFADTAYPGTDLSATVV